MANSKLSMKLLIDNSKVRRVLFAEASKDSVDFLFNILSLPVATIIRLLKEEGMEGSLPNLYKSLEDLNDTYLLPNHNKDAFLKPLEPVSGSSAPLMFLPAAPTKKMVYRCDSCDRYASDDPRAICPSCEQLMEMSMTYVAPPGMEVASKEGGLVKGVVTYMVMDDLVIKPMSTISSITMLSKFNVKEVGALEEKVVDLGMKEAIKLLKTSLETNSVLTAIFC